MKTLKELFNSMYPDVEAQAEKEKNTLGFSLWYEPNKKFSLNASVYSKSRIQNSRGESVGYVYALFTIENEKEDSISVDSYTSLERLFPSENLSGEQVEKILLAAMTSMNSIVKLNIPHKGMIEYYPLNEKGGYDKKIEVIDQEKWMEATGGNSEHSKIVHYQMTKAGFCSQIISQLFEKCGPGRAREVALLYSAIREKKSDGAIILACDGFSHFEGKNSVRFIFSSFLELMGVVPIDQSESCFLMGFIKGEESGELGKLVDSCNPWSANGARRVVKGLKTLALWSYIHKGNFC